ncbi:MAG: hypothetical protein ACLS4Z_04455 [Christensenellaceae bacterium]
MVAYLHESLKCGYSMLMMVEPVRSFSGAVSVRALGAAWTAILELYYAEELGRSGSGVQRARRAGGKAFGRGKAWTASIRTT